MKTKAPPHQADSDQQPLQEQSEEIASGDYGSNSCKKPMQHKVQINLSIPKATKDRTGLKVIVPENNGKARNGTNNRESILSNVFAVHTPELINQNSNTESREETNDQEDQIKTKQKVSIDMLDHKSTLGEAVLRETGGDGATENEWAHLLSYQYEMQPVKLQQFDSGLEHSSSPSHQIGFSPSKSNVLRQSKPRRSLETDENLSLIASATQSAVHVAAKEAAKRKKTEGSYLHILPSKYKGRFVQQQYSTVEAPGTQTINVEALLQNTLHSNLSNIVSRPGKGSREGKNRAKNTNGAGSSRNLKNLEIQAKTYHKNFPKWTEAQQEKMRGHSQSPSKPINSNYESPTKAFLRTITSNMTAGKVSSPTMSARARRLKSSNKSKSSYNRQASRHTQALLQLSTKKKSTLYQNEDIMFLLENKSELINGSPQKKQRVTSAQRRFNPDSTTPPQNEVVGCGIKIERAAKRDRPIEPQTESLGKPAIAVEQKRAESKSSQSTILNKIKGERDKLGGSKERTLKIIPLDKDLLPDNIEPSTEDKEEKSKRQDGDNLQKDDLVVMEETKVSLPGLVPDMEQIFTEAQAELERTSKTMNDDFQRLSSFDSQNVYLQQKLKHSNSFEQIPPTAGQTQLPSVDNIDKAETIRGFDSQRHQQRGFRNDAANEYGASTNLEEASRTWVYSDSKQSAPAGITREQSKDESSLDKQSSFRKYLELAKVYPEEANKIFDKNHVKILDLLAQNKRPLLYSQHHSPTFKGYMKKKHTSPSKLTKANPSSITHIEAEKQSARGSMEPGPSAGPSAGPSVLGPSAIGPSALGQAITIQNRNARSSESLQQSSIMTTNQQQPSLHNYGDMKMPLSVSELLTLNKIKKIGILHCQNQKLQKQIFSRKEQLVTNHSKMMKLISEFSYMDPISDKSNSAMKIQPLKPKVPPETTTLKSSRSVLDRFPIPKRAAGKLESIFATKQGSLAPTGGMNSTLLNTTGGSSLLNLSGSTSGLPQTTEKQLQLRIQSLENTLPKTQEKKPSIKDGGDQESSSKVKYVQIQQQELKCEPEHKNSGKPLYKPKGTTQIKNQAILAQQFFQTLKKNEAAKEHAHDMLDGVDLLGDGEFKDISKQIEKEARLARASQKKKRANPQAYQTHQPMSRRQLKPSSTKQPEEEQRTGVTPVGSPAPDGFHITQLSTTQVGGGFPQAHQSSTQLEHPNPYRILVKASSKEIQKQSDSSRRLQKPKISYRDYPGVAEAGDIECLQIKTIDTELTHKSTEKLGGGHIYSELDTNILPSECPSPSPKQKDGLRLPQASTSAERVEANGNDDNIVVFQQLQKKAQGSPVKQGQAEKRAMTKFLPIQPPQIIVPTTAEQPINKVQRQAGGSLSGGKLLKSQFHDSRMMKITQQEVDTPELTAEGVEMKPVLEEPGSNSGGGGGKDNFYFGACIEAISKMHSNSSSDLLNMTRFQSIKNSSKIKKGSGPLRRPGLHHQAATAAGQGALVHESSIHNLKIQQIPLMKNFSSGSNNMSISKFGGWSSNRKNKDSNPHMKDQAIGCSLSINDMAAQTNEDQSQKSRTARESQNRSNVQSLRNLEKSDFGEGTQPLAYKTANLQGSIDYLLNDDPLIGQQNPNLKLAVVSANKKINIYTHVEPKKDEEGAARTQMNWKDNGDIKDHLSPSRDLTPPKIPAASSQDMDEPTSALLRKTSDEESKDKQEGDFADGGLLGKTTILQKVGRGETAKFPEITEPSADSYSDSKTSPSKQRTAEAEDEYQLKQGDPKQMTMQPWVIEKNQASKQELSTSTMYGPILEIKNPPAPKQKQFGVSSMRLSLQKVNLKLDRTAAIGMNQRDESSKRSVACGGNDPHLKASPALYPKQRSLHMIKQQQQTQALQNNILKLQKKSQQILNAAKNYESRNRMKQARTEQHEIQIQTPSVINLSLGNSDSRKAPQPSERSKKRIDQEAELEMMKKMENYEQLCRLKVFEKRLKDLQASLERPTNTNPVIKSRDTALSYRIKQSNSVIKPINQLSTLPEADKMKIAMTAQQSEGDSSRFFFGKKSKDQGKRSHQHLVLGDRSSSLEARIHPQMKQTLEIPAYGLSQIVASGQSLKPSSKNSSSKISNNLNINKLSVQP